MVPSCQLNEVSYQVQPESRLFLTFCELNLIFTVNIIIYRL